MHTPEQAKVAGDKLRQILLELAVTHNDIVGILDESKNQEEYVLHIKKTVDIVRNQIWPAYSKKKVLLYEEGRSVRSFDFEHMRLWEKAINLFIKSVRFPTPSAQSYLESQENESILQEFQKLLRARIEKLTIPLLEDLETPGDDFLLYIYELMLAPDEQATIDNIAATGKTPSELGDAFCGMLGLLIEAKRAKQQANMNLAYSFLLDANHLIGMHESARYVMKYLPDVAKKRRAQLNSAKSREQVNKLKVRAYELFTELRPTDEDGKPQRWEKAVDAASAVWTALEEEAYVDRKSMPGITYSTVLSLCRELHKLDADNRVVDIRIEVVQIFPDGTERKVPIG